jgi:uncharacterized protein
MGIVIDTMALLLVACIGFAAHRASLCTVKAVGEVLTSGTCYVLASFGKAVLWAALVYGAILLVLPVPASGFAPYESRVLLLAGAFLFGVGAAINGGCSMSTLQRLADGDLRMLAALAAFCSGALAWSVISPSLHLGPGMREPVAWETLGTIGYALITLFALWALWELQRLWRARPRHIAWWRLPLAEAYRLSTAAAVLGVVGGLLYGVKGAWSYTNYLRTHIDTTYRGVDGPPLLHALLFAALFAGMVVSALQRRSLRLRGASLRALMPHVYGGLLMGIGAGMVPGGNDTLMLVGLPTLSLWALAAYLALLSGIAATLVMMRGMGTPLPHVQCPNDLCIERPRNTVTLPRA